MRHETEISAYDRLSKNDRDILSRPEVRATILGVRPAAFEDWHGEMQDPMSVQSALRSEGVDVVVTPHMIVNVAALDERIHEERDLAREAGWKNGMTARQLAERYQSEQPNDRMDTLRGFLLGFPASAIRGFARREELRAEGVPWRPEEFLNPERLPELLESIRDRRGKATLERMVAEAEALPKRSWAFGPDRPDAADEQALLDRYRPAIEQLYRTYWRLSKEDAETLAYATGVHLLGPGGEPAISFVVFGKNGPQEPDVLDLRRRFDEAMKKDTKTK